MRQDDAVEFYAWDLKKIYNISGINGSGTGELLDDLVESLPQQTEVEGEDLPRFAVVDDP